MSNRQVTPFLTSLTKIAFFEDNPDAGVNSIVYHAFKRFREVLSFENPLHLDDYFKLSGFMLADSTQIIRDHFISLHISATLTSTLTKDNLLKEASVAVVKLIQNPSAKEPIKSLMELPENLFQRIFIDIFVLYWMPMKHVLYKVLLPDNSHIQLSFIYELLSDLEIFEKLYDTCKDLQLFIYSWMQHVTMTKYECDLVEHDRVVEKVMNCLARGRLIAKIHEPSSLLIQRDPRKTEPLTFVEILKSGTSQNSHEIAGRLERNMIIRLEKEFVQSDLTPCTAITSLLTGIKVAHHLCEASQYVHAIRVARAVYMTIAKHFESDNRFKKAQVRMQYETLCILLRAMNGFIEYRDPRDRALFTEEATQLLDRIAQLEAHYTEQQLPYIQENLSEEELQQLSPAVRDLLREKSVFRLCTGYLNAQLASYHYAMCHYARAYRHTCTALEEVVNKRPHPMVTVEVFRVMCKLCTIRRHFSLGMKVIRYAVSLAREAFGRNSLPYATMLLEYGCLLLNTDKTRMAAEIYRLGLTLILDCLPGCSVIASLALEDIAYAYYVLEYTSGSFDYALRCAKASGSVLNALGHPRCMQAASANRVRGLIIEEIAIDDQNEEQKAKKLDKSRSMHLASLKLCKDTYGEENIQTAKHYGNLGRLYQSMKLNTEAEQMHLKAIKIKEKLLGPSDFEVGLSVGHLASLYNYDMNRFEDAEELYLRSVDISLKLFGPTYSGLEYDYRGLQRVYTRLRDTNKLRHYQILFDEWHSQRQKLRANEPTESSDLEPNADDLDLAEILAEYRDPSLFSWFEEGADSKALDEASACQMAQQELTNRRNGDCY